MQLQFHNCHSTVIQKRPLFGSFASLVRGHDVPFKTSQGLMKRDRCRSSKSRQSSIRVWLYLGMVCNQLRRSRGLQSGLKCAPSPLPYLHRWRMKD